jgi:hypothetical protein
VLLLLLVNPWNFVTISIMKVQVKTLLPPTNPCILLPAEWWNCKWKNPSFTVSCHSPISSSDTHCSFQITVCSQLYQWGFFWLSII